MLCNIRVVNFFFFLSSNLLLSFDYSLSGPGSSSKNRVSAQEVALSYHPGSNREQI